MSIARRLNSIYDTFSRRKGPKGKRYPPDVIEQETRNRVLLLLRDVYAGRWNADPYNPSGDNTEQFWNQIHNILEHLYGRAKLSNDSDARTARNDGLAFTLRCEPTEFLDVLEAIFKVDCTWRVVSERNDLVDAINIILRSDDTPYQLTPVVTHEQKSGGSYGHTTITTVALPKVVRVDEEVAHNEAVLPALSILTDPKYSGANDEFRKALDDYRKGDFEDCLVKCGSAFESVLKVLCQKNTIAFDPHKDTAGRLLDKVLPKSTLDSGTFKEPLIAIARMRNRLSVAHGGGAKVKAVDRHVAQYAVTTTAAAIVLLVHDMGA